MKRGVSAALLLVAVACGDGVPLGTPASVGAATVTASGPVRETPDAADPGTGPLVAPPGDVWRGEVVRVSDGDTLRVDVVDIPRSLRDVIRVGQERKLRLLRIDAPEVAREDRDGDCLAADATARLQRLAPEGSELTLAYDVERFDQYGRDLVHAWTADGTWLNGTMLSEGLARVVGFGPNDAYDAEVRELEARARVEPVGIWDEARCP